MDLMLQVWQQLQDIRVVLESVVGSLDTTPPLTSK
jgi:hypothetical protein